jgi:hypothetical protein
LPPAAVISPTTDSTAARSLRPYRGTAHSVTQWTDPRPQWLRTRFALKELLPW